MKGIFNYRFQEVEVEYEVVVDSDPEYNPEIVVQSVFYNGTDITMIMSQTDELELKEEIYDILFN
jgi:hypothetical protein